MKHFRIIAFLFLLFVALQSMGQSTSLDIPASTIIPHYRLCVSFNTTTVLLFASAVRPVDRGDRDFIAQKQAGLENVLKLKAAKHGFPVTNLHVFTGDGKVYAFDIYYSDSLASTYNLAILQPTSPAGTVPPVYFSNGLPNSEDLSNLIALLDKLPSSRIASQRRYKMTLTLQKIGMADGLFFLRLKLANRSPLDYKIDFSRLYIKDRQKTKRSSLQEQEISPLFEDSSAFVPGYKSITHTIVLPTFTLADGKEFLIQFFEKNGGRSISIHVTNKQLFKLSKI